MESTDTISISEERDSRIAFVRRLFSLAAIIAATMFAVGLVMLTASKALGLQEKSRAIFFTCMYFGSIGFFVTTVAHLLLDIMYGIFGLLQVKVLRLLGWMFLIIISLFPLAGIFAASHLAEGLQG